MYPQESCADADLVDRDFYEFNSVEVDEIFNHTKPPQKSYLRSAYEMEVAKSSPVPHPREYVFLQRHNTRSFETTRTEHSSSGNSFSTSGYAYRSSSSIQTRSRSSTLATELGTECTSTTIRIAPTLKPQRAPTPQLLPQVHILQPAQTTRAFQAPRPTPIPRGNTFVNELVPTKASNSAAPNSKSRVQITTTEKQIDQLPQYPTPWGKKKGAWWRRLKFWEQKPEKEFGWGERYEIWMVYTKPSGG